MTSEELQWAVKSLLAGMIWTSGRNDTEADVWDEVDALFAERAARDEMLLTGSPITLTDDECEAIMDTVASAWSLLSHMRGPIRSTIAETLAVVNGCAVGLNPTPAPVGASSTAVDETQGDAVPRFTAEEVAERLVRVVKAEICQTYSPMVYVGQVCVSIEDSNASAARKADAIRATIRRTLEASE